jgi:hypothetical protein
MNPQLWLNNTDPDLEAIARYADPSHEACEGTGVVCECGEWAFCSCTEAALLAAAEEPEFASVVRLLSPQPGFRQATEFFTREQEPLKRMA